MSEDEIADIQKILEKHPEWGKWTYNDLVAERCRLQANIDDETARHAQIYRENGFLAPYDGRLIREVCGRLNVAPETTLHDVIQYLRLKRRRGHKQQELLDVWDRYYKNGARFADDETVDRLEEIFRSREDAREKAKATK